ncbi:restriction endonuclease subunit S [Lacticaseibacillus paracasei]|uniref:restriction endonuclease subunit S n=1 Tax=Lacticaseibacillus paracasei TaxID=1597 RepID=UPI0021C4A554|nr:restriction endonuclease subunit S [Lacticaseibacillus paracasei]MCP9310762.1 restriction endonuclease subunit S [Lacticaseibacillus paracasei]
MNAWEKRKLGDILNYEQPTPYIVRSENYQNSFPTPVLTAGKSLLLGYTNETNGIKSASKSSPVIIFDDFTTSSHLIDFPFKIKSSAMKILSPSNNDSDIYFSFGLLSSINYVSKNHERHWISQFSNFRVQVPSVHEQACVSRVLLNVTDLIAATQHKIDALEQAKKALLQRLFDQSWRFKGYSDPWEKRKLGEISPLRGGFAFKSSEFKDKGIPIIRISNIKSDGKVGGDFVYYHEQEVDQSYLLPQRAALLAMSGATTGKVAILHKQHEGKYYQNQRVGYFSKVKDASYSFISVLIRSDLFLKQLKSVLVAGAQPNVSSKEIDQFIFSVPATLNEQEKIGTFFEYLDSLIAATQSRLSSLELLKKALLQDLFI